MTDPTIAAENYVAKYDRSDGLDLTARDVLHTAIHMLHEQAHGNVAFRTCPNEPCRSLYYLPITGVAPRVLR